jgi:uncharacterized delta-60 repeat protein
MSIRPSRIAVGLAMLIATSSMCGAADGLLDTTFGGSDGAGRVDLDFARPAGNFDSPRVVVVQRDHRIVVAGPCGAANGNTDICAGRLLPDGALDTTFSGGRVAIALDLGGDNADLVTDMAVDHAGRTLILANTSGGALFLIRLTATGGLDATWGDASPGIRALGGSQGGLSGSTQRLAIDDNDRYVVASTYPAGYPTSPSSDLVVARYLDTNAVDTAFAPPAGALPLSFSDNPDAVRSLDIDSGGNILLGVTVTEASGSDAGVVRLTGAGAIDTGWGSSGKRLIDFGTSGHGGDLRRVSALADRSVVVATTAGIARLTTSGDLDGQFGSNGTHAVSCSALLGSALTIRSARLVDAHHIVIAGSSGSSAAAARVLLDSGDLDPAFDGGCVSVPFVTSSDAATTSAAFSLALQNAHPIVAVDFNYGPTGIDMGVARLTDETIFRDAFDW